MRFLWFLFLFCYCVVELIFCVNKSCLLMNLSDYGPSTRKPDDFAQLVDLCHFRFD